MDNLKSGRMMGDSVPWYVIFRVGCWLVWKWRNECIFTEKVTQRKAIHVRTLAGEFFRVFNLILMQVSQRQSAPLLVRWLPSEEGWIKINMDGALCREDNRITAGGVIRNCKGEWIKGFIANIGVGFDCCRALGCVLWPQNLPGSSK